MSQSTATSTLADDVLDGLTRPFKELPPKHFYDERGSQLFDLACDQPEYYPTRTERAILEAHAAEIVAATGATELVELGSGTAEKTRVLLDAMRDAGTLRRYVAFDVDASVVTPVAAAFERDYPGAEVVGVVGDFESDLGSIPPPDTGGGRIVAFLGGTVGNFLPGARRAFLRGLGATLGPEGHLLLGTDLVKPVEVVEAAYNDAAGVSAAFNKNVLSVMNAQLGAEFDLDAFDHVAFFDPEHEWIEMRLRSRRAQTVRIRDLDLDVRFDRGEEMRTEISAKFTRERLEADLAAADLALEELYTDPKEMFALSLSRVAGPNRP